MPNNLTYYSDSMRHLICVPYSVENLHRMADDLGIKRCWFHATADRPHYDIPLRRFDEISAKTTVVSPKKLIKIIRYESSQNN